MPRRDASAERLRRHFVATYLSLRLGVAVVGAALPLVLWFGGLYLLEVPLQHSMSAYYHTALRDVFVGALLVVGFALFVYRGFSAAENVALNIAGVSAICIALFPTSGSGERTIVADVHAVAGIVFFACLAYVSSFRAADTLSLVRDTRWARVLRAVYGVLGVAMLASPVAALAVERGFRPPGAEPSIVFFVQAFGAWVFALFWVVKTAELRVTSADRAAARGILEPVRRLERTRVPGRLVQTAPLDESVEELREQLAFRDGR